MKRGLECRSDEPAVAEIAGAVTQISADAQRAEGEITEVVSVAEESSAEAEQVSASTQQSSASTQEIAASAQSLASGTARTHGGVAARLPSAGSHQARASGAKRPDAQMTGRVG